MNFVHCKECTFWRPHGGAFKSGRCQRHAPEPLMTAETEPDVDAELSVVWPLTMMNDGCGEGCRKGNKT